MGLSFSLVAVTAGAAQPGDLPKPPVVSVSQPVQREVTDYADFTGRTDAVTHVEVRARVSGYLVKVHFKEGSEVQQGELLFEVDPRPYQAELDQAQAALALSEARLRRLAAELQRAKQLAAGKAISQEELDKIAADHAEAEAAVRVPKAAVAAAQLKLSFTRVAAPCSGVIGRSLLSPGSLVKADETALAQIVTLDPMYVYFDVEEATLLRIRQGINAGKVKPADPALPVWLGLVGEPGYPHQGTVDFVDNQVNPQTGTIKFRAVFANPRPPAGVRLMAPGMFARVRLPLGAPYAALLVTDRAIGSDQGQKYVYVVDADGKVQSRPVTTGALQADGLRVIATGLKAGDSVVVEGLTKLRPGMVVSPKVVPMPAAEASPAPGAK
jgi:multidrug efflux system membrane fusion protein